MTRKTDRREFLRASATAGLGLTVGTAAVQAGARAGARSGSESASQAPAPSPGSAAYAAGFAAPPLETVRMAFVGVGLQGGSHVQNFLRVPGVEIVAVCDVDEPRAREVAQWVADDGRAAPDLYTRGETDFQRLCERDDVDVVFNATPWRWHVPVCVAAMESGKHTAVEVPASTTVDGCWQLVETAERTGRHCVMMENCCYGRREMMIFRMVREGLFGELLHVEGAYIHDLRAIKFSDKNEGLWRLDHSVGRDGNLYPTHGIGPIAQCLDIGRGDRFETLVSMSSNARGLRLYAEKTLEDGDPRIRDYALGDMNTSLIRTANGRTVLLQHDTTSPRPYSRINLVQGTRGTATGYPDRIHVEGRTEGHGWEELEAYREEFDHPLWTQLERDAAGAGHGGMDYLEDYRLIASLRAGETTDMDVYDAADWSVIVGLSELSVAEGSRPVDFPDFTRGAWKSRSPLGIVG